MDGFPASLDTAIAEYEHRKCGRFVEELQLQKAKELMKREAWEDALRVLRPLWHGMSYRKEGWWDIVEDIGWSLRTVASHTGDGGSIVAVDWELMNKTFPSKLGWSYDIANALQGLKSVTHKPAVVVREQDVHSFLSATFAFEHPESKVAELCTCQLTVTSHASKVSAPVNMAEIKILYDGGPKPVILRHKLGNSQSNSSYTTVQLSEGTTLPSDSGSPSAKDFRHAALVGEDDLTFAAGQTRVFEFSFPLREPGQVKATSTTFSMATDLFDLDYVVDFERVIIPDLWWFQKKSKKRMVRIDPCAVNILPKPPKMDVRFVGLQDQYYTNEPIKLQLEIWNGEDEDTFAKLRVHIAGDQAPPLILKLPGSANDKTEDEGELETSEISLGTVQMSNSTLATVEIPPSMLASTHDMIVDLSYNIVSDLETPIYRTVSVRLFIVSPFEANYDFSPRLDLKPWPSFFTHAEVDDIEVPVNSTAAGLSQKWCLTSRYASFAVSTLHISSVSLEILSLNGGITCHCETYAELTELLPIQPSSIEEARFSVTTQKISLDDRRSASLDLALVITWHRTPDSPPNTTHIAVPRLLVASSEPRVLASLSPSPAHLSSQIIILTYTIENPSMHFLTFGVNMNPSEDFAFSGIKQGSLQLVPLSRRQVNVILLPNVRGKWIKPVFVCKDRYFQKVLKVVEGEGMRSDPKEGILVWVSPEEDNE